MKTEINNSVVVNNNLFKVFNFLKEVENHKQLHPLIIKVEKLSEKETGSASLERIYTITDQIKLFGFFTKYQQYNAIQRFEGENFFSFEVPETNGIRVQSKFNFTEITQTGTRISITATIKAPWFLVGFVKKQANKSHKTLLQNCKNVLESS